MRAQQPQRPRWIPVVAMLAVLPVLLWLGFWQLDRAAQKRAMFDQFSTAGPVVDFETIATLPPEQIRYRPVRVSGRYDPTRQFLLEGMTHGGRPGLHVLTPLALDHGPIVIVNRGWIPETRTRETAVDLPVSRRHRVINALVVPYPQPGLRLAAEAGDGWPRRVLYPTAEDISAQLEHVVLAPLLWLGADEPDGFVRDWRPAEFGPARHIGYAVQWFALAITLVLIYVVLRYRRRHDG